MSPAAALAGDLRARGYHVCLATDTRGRSYSADFGSSNIHVLKAGYLGSGLTGKIEGALKLGAGYFQARKLIKRLRPEVVVGFGGYPSIPAVLAAQHLNISTIIHEQNAVLGRANAFLAPRAGRVATSLPGTAGLDEADAVRAVVTGNPVRAAIAELYTRPYPELRHDGTLQLFVIGGSLGARVFSNVVPQALSTLDPAYKNRLNVVQQARTEDLERTRRAYETAGISAELQPYFDDVATRLGAAHLVIARAGASTVAEIATAGRPAIFVPYPHHADQQQKINAETVADAGGAWVMTEAGFTPDALSGRIETFLQNPQTLFRAAENARACAKPDAARRLGNLVTALASGWESYE
jgi:UDP-N-acetylglucosamine--N-acetylmuramyl-(pentapeptide) pyrophosphoryl-undecaprenol N-acetylglucosamine transferase